jgi:hypothetical protein
MEPGMSFSYYLYVSDSKIDMLLPQISPGSGGKRKSEFGVDLKVLTAKRTVEPSAGDRIARLETVVRYLRDHGDLGSVDEPGQFFWGLLPMRWGPFPAQAGTETGSSLVFFGGRTDKTVVGLGGSLKHVLGSVPDADEPSFGRSPMPALLDGLGLPSDLEDEYVADAVDADLDSADRAALVRVRHAVTSLRWPAQNVEFVAKRLLQGDDGQSDPKSVLLGSPVYVALVD